ncbi:kelch-like protein 24 [Branchiostoma lanceolatum]|uniref:kelch-like protein 24 n=1 Tax=Branchiostoma lanceolatum TaxID=7740 RepID=UPI0034543295
MDAMDRPPKIPGVEEDCYAARFFRQLQEFRSEGHLADVTLCADGKEIPCHRLVLSACTDYFHAMFRGGHSESTKDKIELLGVDGEALEKLVSYAYTSNIHITMDIVQPLFEAANMLQVKPVEDACAKFLEDNLSSKTCLRTWALADKLLYTRLSVLARRYALKTFEDVCGAEDFLQLPVDFLKMYISDEGLHARKEERVLEAIMLWARDDLKERQRHLKKLIECVRFSRLEKGVLKNMLETGKIVPGVLGIKELIKDESANARPRLIDREEILVFGGVTGKQYETEANGSMFKLNLRCDMIDCKPMTRSLQRTEGVAVCVVNNDVIVAGLSQAWRYNSTRNSWTKLASLRKGRMCHGMAAVDGQVYAVGGKDKFGDAIKDVEAYTEKRKSWKRVTPLKLAVYNFGIAACSDKVYAFGGKLNSRFLKPTSVAQCFDPIQDEWTFVKQLPEPAAYIKACTVKSKIYLVGGSLSCVLCYDPQQDFYEKMAAKLAPWNHCSASVCGSEIYITGGRLDVSGRVNSASGPHAKVQCYDVSSNTMSVGSVKGLPVPLYAHHTVTVSKH